MAFRTFLAILLLLALASPTPGHADWAKNLVTDPALESPVPAVPEGVKRNVEYFFFIPKTGSTPPSSSYIHIPFGANLDVSLDNDVDSEVTSTSTVTMQFMCIQHNNGNTEPTAADTDLATPLLDVTFDGKTAATRTIHDVKGPMWCMVDNITGDATQDALVSISHRAF